MVLSPTGKVLYANQPLRGFLAALHRCGSPGSTVERLPPPLAAVFEDLVQTLSKRATDHAQGELEMRTLTVTAENRSFMLQAFGLPGHQDSTQRVLFAIQETDHRRGRGSA